MEKETGGVTREPVGLAVTEDVGRIEAPVTWKAYMICAFASFGGIFFGYDSGYINGVLGNEMFITSVEGRPAKAINESDQSLIVSILSCGTFFGALIAGDVSDWIGRKWTVIIGCLIYMVGVVIQMLTGIGAPLGPIVAGRLIAGVGVGFESAIVILYMSEIVGSLLLANECSGTSANTTSQSAPRRFAVLSLLATSSASPSVCCSPLASSMEPRAALTPAPTASP